MTIEDTRSIHASFNSNLIREMPGVLDILLRDRTTLGNIIWATDSYEELGKGFQMKDIISRPLITGKGKGIIKPRVMKVKEEQKERTKKRAEVFTPLFIIKKMNDGIENEFKGLPLDEYINKTWLEITCGEGPYMVSPYDAATGAMIPISERVGFVDRKLQQISKEVNDHDDWLDYTYQAFKSSYGYDFQGDSLLIARENMLYTFLDYYIDKFHTMPHVDYIKEVAYIISFNVFQMDGLKYIIPLSDGYEYVMPEQQLDLFGYELEQEPIKVEKEAVKVKLKNWDTGKMIEFEEMVHSD